jgi:uncharacterized protein (DUF924 family)
MIKTSILCICSMVALNDLVAAVIPVKQVENAPVIQPAVPVIQPAVPENKTNEENSLLLKNHYNDVLNLWFGPLDGPDFYPTLKASTWFSKTTENKRLMNDHFEEDLKLAVKGDYNIWRESPHGRLALILLLDQIPRNIYGNKPQAFSSDRMAQGLVLEGLQKGDDLKLLPLERAFFYLPLLHAEDPKLQALSISKYQELVNEATPANQSHLQEFLTYAIIHRDIINKFGRFPSRNAIYGRDSTPDEVAYLKEWGSYPN